MSNFRRIGCSSDFHNHGSELPDSVLSPLGLSNILAELLIYFIATLLGGRVLTGWADDFGKKVRENMNVQERHVFFPVHKIGFCLSHQGDAACGGLSALSFVFLYWDWQHV